ncbi:replicative DNA helicase [Candidatus Daviesbacteria bacterium]|nr:replicative DNA helicase [Candidatus Daviesbacteria bacterium]
MAVTSSRGQITNFNSTTSKNSLSAKLPPQNVEAEQSLLGALLIDKDAIVSIAESLKPEHFYKEEQHGHIYDAILELFEKREPIDLVTVTEKLKQKGVLDMVGGSAYLTELVNMVPTAAHVQSYARIIIEHALRRILISNSTRFVDMAFDEARDVSEVIEECEQSIFALSQQHVRRDFIQLKDALAESFDRLDEIQKSSGKLRGVPSGFKDLDNKLAGFQDSNLIIFAARPGQGKTSFVLNVAQHVAVTTNLPVGIFSLEMSQEELVDRIVVGQADIDAWKLKTGRLDDKDFDRMTHAYGQLAEAPLFIDDTPGISISEMRTKARRLQAEHGLRMIIVDYLQLVRGRNLENRVQEVSEISQNLKNLARELKVPVLTVSQLSRAVEARGTRRPQLADLRESGAIEQDADVVMFIYREDPEKLEDVTLDIQKHRNGPTGEIKLFFRADRVKFYGMEKMRGRTAPPAKEDQPQKTAAA